MSKPLDPRLLRAAPGLRRLLASVTVTQAITGVLTISQAVLFAHIIGAQFGSHHESVWSKILVLLGIGGLRAGVTGAQEWITQRASGQLRSDLRTSVLAAVVRRGPGWQSRQPPGRLAAASGAGLEGVDGYVTRALPAMVAACVVPPLVLVEIVRSDLQSALIFIAVLPLVPLFMVLVGITTRRRMTEQHQALTAMAGHFLDLVQGLRTLKIYGQDRRQQETVAGATDAYRRKTMAMLRMAFMSGLVLDLLATLGIAVVAVDIGLRLDAGDLTLTRALVVLLLAPELFAPLRAVGAQFHAHEQGTAAIDAALAILEDAGDSPAEVSHDQRRLHYDGGLRLRSLSVDYGDRTQLALTELTLDVCPGEVLALQGPSGAGKSTVLAAMLDFVPYSGEVLIGDMVGWRSLRELDPASWRANIGWVPQRPSTTQDTVGAEVRLGDPDATDLQVADALRLCHAPMAGCLLGEDGRNVSAGERRRIALARAVLRAEAVIRLGGTPLLLLDEPSEDLDPATETIVLRVIGEMAGRATTIMASHSSAALAVADRRVLLSGGQLVRVLSQRPDRSTVTATVRAERIVDRPMLTGTPLPSLRTRLLTHATRRLAGSALLSGAAGLSGVALMTTSIWLICRAAQHPNLQALAIAVVGVRAFALGKAVLRYAERLVSHDRALSMLGTVRTRVFAGLIPLSPQGLDGLRRGDLLRRFLTDVDAVQEGLVRAAVPTAGAVITAVGASLFAASLDPAAGAVLAGGLVAAVLAVPLLTRALAGSGATTAAVAARRDDLVTSTLSGLTELTAYGAEWSALTAISSMDDELQRQTRRSSFAAGLGSGLLMLTNTATTVGLLAVAVGASEHGAISAVTVGVLLGCCLASFEAVTPLPAAYAAWGRFMAARDRVLEVLDRPAVMPTGNTVPRFQASPGFRTVDVSLSAFPGGPELLSGINIEGSPGHHVIVTGPSGSGKSTLLAAAMRLQPLISGEVDLLTATTATPLVDVVATAVPPLVAGSLQGDHVFNTSLRDNLRVVRPLATDDELSAVAERAGLAAFVRGLPEQWSTPAGPDGCALSGGQRQRLLLARALLAAPEIMVLDEPTAHLDEATGQRILANLLADKHRTLLISTHRAPATEHDASTFVIRNAVLQPAETRELVGRT